MLAIKLSMSGCSYLTLYSDWRKPSGMAENCGFKKEIFIEGCSKSMRQPFWFKIGTAICIESPRQTYWIG